MAVATVEVDLLVPLKYSVVEVTYAVFDGSKTTTVPGELPVGVASVSVEVVVPFQKPVDSVE